MSDLYSQLINSDMICEARRRFARDGDRSIEDDAECGSHLPLPDEAQVSSISFDLRKELLLNLALF